MKSPVVDVHAHVFNVDDIPVQGFLTQAHGVPAPIAEIVLRIVQGLAPDDRIDMGVLQDHEPTNEEVDFALDACMRQNPELRERVQACIRIDDADRDRWAVEVWRSAWRHAKWALTVMTRSHAALTQRMIDSYRDVELFVPLMIDMEHWVPDSSTLAVREQIEDVMTPLVERFAGRVHPFVPFNPARERRDGDSLTMVRDAMENRGFIGVKIDPLFGYAPTGNNVLDLPGIDRPDEIDAALHALYSYCEVESVPIAAQCSASSATAVPGREDLAHPRHWAAVLEEFPELRINLGHFGGEQDLARSPESSWAYEIAGLMNRYPNVYADTGHHAIVHNRRLRDRFFDRLTALYDRYPTVRDRFLFGTDCHLIVRDQDNREFLQRYRRFYRDHYGPEETAKFMGESAMDFLDLRVGGKNRERLGRYYLDHGLQPPTWYSNLDVQEALPRPLRFRSD